MKILLVGPGIMPIPSMGWGAVETVIWQQKIHLEKQGHKVDILNKRGLLAALRAKPKDYDLVHLHYDELAGFWVKLSKILKFPLFITSHYGYAAFPDKWESYYKKIFKALMKSDHLLVLSPEIKQVYKSKGYKGWIGVTPNGTEVNEMGFKKNGNGKAICLGKVEKRKRQADLANLLSKSDVKIDFVGPKVDENFHTNDKNVKYLGVWDRDQVHKNLTDYATLVLFSDGEAHALVICEALAAGLSVVVSKEASANLDLSKPWIFVEEELDKKTALDIKEACAQNLKFREKIREYAITNFSWDAAMRNYINQVKEGLKK
jgi:glycosyltransferase involved in cell wall biosynthesis